MLDDLRCRLEAGAARLAILTCRCSNTWQESRHFKRDDWLACGLTPVKILYRLRLQNLFPGVIPQAALRVMAVGFIVVCRSKGKGAGLTSIN